MYKRLCNPLLSRSFFLFGPRGSGKTTLLRELFADKSTLWIDLLHEEQMITFVQDLRAFQRLIKAAKPQPEWIVIDEIQKVPYLLDEVHAFIEDRSFSSRLKFALTGSSARKLRHGAANLLAGRALLNYLHPLTHLELGSDFSLDEALNWGTLPDVIKADSLLEKGEILKAYAATYLREEIRQEQLIRKLDPFLRFLQVAAQCNGEILNYAKIAKDTLTNPVGVERYFEVLDDTLVGFFLEPFHRSIRKRQSKKAKFYFFDPGIKRAIEGTLDIPLKPHNYAYGRAFEHFIVLECHRLNNYYRRDYRFSYFATQYTEVDLVVERPGKPTILIEVKSSNRVDDIEARKLATLAKDFGDVEKLIFSQVPRPMLVEGVSFLPWEQGIARLFE